MPRHVELLEHARKVGGLDSRAGVGDRQLEVTVHGSHPDGDRARLRGVAKGVLDEVSQELGDAVRIGLDGAGGFDVGGEPNPSGFGARLESLDHLPDVLAHVDRLEMEGELAGLEAGQQHEIFDEPAQPSGLTSQHTGDPVGLGLIEVALFEHLGIAGDGGERRTEIMTHAEQELPLAALEIFELTGHLVERAGHGGHLVITFDRRPGGHVARRQRRRRIGQSVEPPGHPPGEQPRKHGRQRRRHHEGECHASGDLAGVDHRRASSHDDGQLHRPVLASRHRNRPSVDEHGQITVDVAGVDGDELIAAGSDSLRGETAAERFGGRGGEEVDHAISGHEGQVDQWAAEQTPCRGHQLKERLAAPASHRRPLTVQQLSDRAGGGLVVSEPLGQQGLHRLRLA